MHSSPNKNYISPDKFAKRAGWNKKWNEHTLQMYAKRKLEDQGYTVKDEVWIGNKTVGAGRIDLLATKIDSTGKERIIIIECKKWLTTKDMGEAMGQIEMYKTYVPNHTDRVVIGMKPNWGNAGYDAERRALMAKNTTGINTVFINTHIDFEPDEADDTRSPTEKLLDNIAYGFQQSFKWLGKFAWKQTKKHFRPWRLTKFLWSKTGGHSYGSYSYGSRGRKFRIRRSDLWLMAIAGIFILVIWF
ncbi:hypothetical protein WA1_18645 [Scytonema hofmannii PCC 7110]|uniref:Uncharacterized protein n=1 Tax=Scytonema hofmannii PCC 7110 TaxID=128403 RepID=A0A139XBF0_9CYAN|nr:hypothetical protein [Scytonema hofmannii]KYC42024.1 hypothetical protein WA1_18645 [Scytonema hofmannii PCC 7110]